MKNMARQAQRDFGRQTERMLRHAFATQAPPLKKNDIAKYLFEDSATRDEMGRVWIHPSHLADVHKSPFTEQDDPHLWYAYWKTCHLPPGVTNVAPPDLGEEIRLHGTVYEITESLLLMTQRRTYGAFRLQER